MDIMKKSSNNRSSYFKRNAVKPVREKINVNNVSIYEIDEPEEVIIKKDRKKKKNNEDLIEK